VGAAGAAVAYPTVSATVCDGCERPRPFGPLPPSTYLRPLQRPRRPSQPAPRPANEPTPGSCDLRRGARSESGGARAGRHRRRGRGLPERNLAGRRGAGDQASPVDRAHRVPGMTTSRGASALLNSEVDCRRTSSRSAPAGPDDRCCPPRCAAAGASVVSRPMARESRPATEAPSHHCSGLPPSATSHPWPRASTMR
jgi:hypothetical protein